MRAIIHVRLKPGVLDPQGKAVKGTLERMGHGAVQDVRVGKRIELILAGLDRAGAEAEVDRLCEALLVNPVMETYSVEWPDSTAAGAGGDTTG